MEDTFDLSVLNSMKYRDLQDLCKKYGIRANQKSKCLVDALMDVKNNNKENNQVLNEEEDSIRNEGSTSKEVNDTHQNGKTKDKEKKDFDDVTNETPTGLSPSLKLDSESQSAPAVGNEIPIADNEKDLNQKKKKNFSNQKKNENLISNEMDTKDLSISTSRRSNRNNDNTCKNSNEVEGKPDDLLENKELTKLSKNDNKKHMEKEQEELLQESRTNKVNTKTLIKNDTSDENKVADNDGDEKNSSRNRKQSGSSNKNSKAIKDVGTKKTQLEVVEESKKTSSDENNPSSLEKQTIKEDLKHLENNDSSVKEPTTDLPIQKKDEIKRGRKIVSDADTTTTGNVIRPRRSPRGSPSTNAKDTKPPVTTTKVAVKSRGKTNPKMVSKDTSKSPVISKQTDTKETKKKMLTTKEKAMKSGKRKVAEKELHTPLKSSNGDITRPTIASISKATTTPRALIKKLKTGKAVMQLQLGTAETSKNNKTEEPKTKVKRNYKPYTGRLPPFEGDSLFSPKKSIPPKRINTDLSQNTTLTTASSSKSPKRTPVKKSLMVKKAHENRRSDYLRGAKKNRTSEFEKHRK